jgi:hypothetical protein
VLWGIYEIEWNSDLEAFEILPVRTIQFQANVTRFLQPPSSPTNLLSVVIKPGSNLLNGYVDVDVTIRHPFVGLKKFRGFDVRGIVMGNGSLFNYLGDNELIPGTSDLRLLNSDGYTRWWNPSEFTTYNTIFGYTEGKLSSKGFSGNATVNGYKYFADDLEAESPISDLNFDSRGTFSVDPGLNTRNYKLQFPGNPSGGYDIKFNYAITASYLSPDDPDPDYPVSSFQITANMPEAFIIQIHDNGSTAFYESSSVYGGDLNLNVEIFDWQSSIKSTVFEDLSGLVLGSPTLFNSPVNVDISPAVKGTSGFSWVVPVSIFDVSPTSIYGQELFIRAGSSSPSTYAPDIPGITGFDFPENALAAFNNVEVPVLDEGPEEAEDCPTEIHTAFEDKLLENLPGSDYVKMDIACPTVGPMAGKLLLQGQPVEVRAYDIDAGTPFPVEDFITIENTFNANDLIHSMDVCDYSGRVIVSIMNKDEVLDPSLFRIYDQNGDFMSELSVGEFREFCVADTNDNGDLWIQVYENPHEDVDGTSWLQHWEFSDAEPYYFHDEADDLDVTHILTYNNQSWDMAISYTLDRLYILRGNYNQAGIAEYGEIYSFDIAPDGTLTENPDVQNLMVFPDEVNGSYTAWHGALAQGDIEIDHSNELTEGCRIIVMANASGVAGNYIGVFDGDLNQIDLQLLDLGSGYCLAIRESEFPGDRPVICSGYTPGEVTLAPAPPGW